MVPMPWASTLRAEPLSVPSLDVLCSFILIPYIFVVLVYGLSDGCRVGEGRVLDFLWCRRMAGPSFAIDEAAAGLV